MRIQNKVVNPAWKNIKGGVPENPWDIVGWGLIYPMDMSLEYMVQIANGVSGISSQKDV